jgi:hypothetical protein
MVQTSPGSRVTRVLDLFGPCGGISRQVYPLDVAVEGLRQLRLIAGARKATMSREIPPSRGRSNLSDFANIFGMTSSHASRCGFCTKSPGR